MISLEKIAKINSFKVPKNYFDELPSAIKQKIRFEEKPNFQIPENYFEGLSGKILSRISKIDNKNIQLENLEKSNVFRVPKGYFETLPENILAKTAKKESKVVQANWFSNRIKWSVAASLILMVGLWFGVPKLTKSETELALEKVSKQEIKSYLENQDLSYLEYQTFTETIKNTENKALEGLKIDKQAILEHLENQDLEEDI